MPESLNENGPTAEVHAYTPDGCVGLTKADVLALGERDDALLIRLCQVTPMALYKHVADKDSILVGVIDVLVERQGLPDPSLRWTDVMTWMAETTHAMFVEYPQTLGVYCRRPVVTSQVERRLDVSSTALEGAGFAPDEATRALAAIHT